MTVSAPWGISSASSRLSSKVCSSGSNEGGSVGLEGSLERLVGCSLPVNNSWELEARLIELLGGCSSAVLGLKNGGSDDLNRIVWGRVSSAHFQIELWYGATEGSVSILLVHVDSASSGQVSEDDSVVLDRLSFLLEDLSGGDDLSLNLSDLVLSFHEVPELGPGKYGVASEHTHSIESGLRVLLWWVFSSDNKELSDLNKKRRLVSACQ